MAVQAADYLELLRLDPTRMPGSLAEELGIEREEVAKWRLEIPGFREEELSLRAAAYQPKEKPKKAKEEEEELDPRLELWLDAFHENRDDRLAACSASGLRWSEVQDAIRSNESFRRRYDEIWTEEIIGVEDKYLKAGKAGRSAAIMTKILEAHDPKYSPKQKITMEHTGTVKLEARMIDGAKEDILAGRHKLLQERQRRLVVGRSRGGDIVDAEFEVVQ
jgi:hypothetical protein